MLRDNAASGLNVRPRLSHEGPGQRTKRLITSVARTAKIFELAFLLEVMPPTVPYFILPFGLPSRILTSNMDGDDYRGRGDGLETGAALGRTVM